jgi:ABC-type transporter Mla MlaB component
MDARHGRAHPEEMDLAQEISAFLIPVAGTYIIVGDLDATASVALAPQLRTAVDRYLDPNLHGGVRPASIRVDLRRLKRLSSDGVTLLENVVARAERSGATTTILVRGGSDTHRALDAVEPGRRLNVEVTSGGRGSPPPA